AEIGIGREVSSLSDQRYESYTQVFTNTLTYDKTLGKHSINVLGGMEYQKLRGNGLGYQGTNFQSTDPSFYTVVSNGTGSNGQFSNASAYAGNEAYASFFGRLSYNYLEKYLLTATVRRDGTSRFAEENRWGTFPAVSAAWIISEEPFFKSVSIIQDLKLRGSWGRLGNSNTSNFAYVARVSFLPQYPLGGVAQQAPIRPTLPNASIGWETVQSMDFSIDFTMFKKKLSVLATYYNRNTIDFLYPLPIGFVSGYSSIDVNVGKVENKGFEFDLGYNTRILNKITFGVSANLTTVRNKLISLAPGVEEYASGDYRTAVGYPIGYFYGYKALGIYQNAAQAAAALPDDVAGSTYQPQPGDVIFEDNNSPLAGDPNGKQFTGVPDGRITPDDRTLIGKTTPDFFYGINLNAGYSAFDLSVFFQGVSGVQVYNQLRASMEGLGGPGRNQFATTQNRWKGEGTSNEVPRAIAGDPYQNNRFSSRFVEDAGFFRLKNLQIGYSISQKILARTNSFKSVRIYLGATNLFVVTKYTGLDPEVVTFGQTSNQLSAGTDQGATPQPRTFQAGLQFGF
ncbi:MAG: SusC/RagA family TonB-linked outer membrane protein, partial [Ferruginibacter sp.]